MTYSIKQQPWLLYRDAQDNGEYARAFWLCAECCRSMEDVASLKVAQQLNATINQLYEETIQRLEAALQSVCNDFHSKQYLKVRPSYNRVDGTEIHQQGWASFMLSCICPTLCYAVARRYMLMDAACAVCAAAFPVPCVQHQVLHFSHLRSDTCLPSF